MKKLTRENLKVVWDQFSTLSWVVFVMTVLEQGPLKRLIYENGVVQNKLNLLLEIFLQTLKHFNS
jgi:hypothetical protein